MKYYRVDIEYTEVYEIYVKAKDKKTAEMKAMEESCADVVSCDAYEVEKKEYDVMSLTY